MAFAGFFVLQDEVGNTKTVHFTVSDVVGENVVFADGQDHFQAPLCTTWIVECVFTATGVNVTKLEIFSNGCSTGDFVVIKLNQYDTIRRQYDINPLELEPGALLVFKQRA